MNKVVGKPQVAWLVVEYLEGIKKVEGMEVQWC